MGNCHATSDVVGIMIEHPEGKVERLYWSITARQLMLQYPGNYVALVPAAPRTTDIKTPLRVAGSKLKLLPPDATLQVGQSYRLISFEDVLLEISEQKFSGGRSSSMGSRSKRIYSDQSDDFSASEDNDQENLHTEDESSSRFPEGTGGFGSYSTMRSMSFSKSSTWRPALQSISELGR